MRFRPTDDEEIRLHKRALCVVAIIAASFVLAWTVNSFAQTPPPIPTISPSPRALAVIRPHRPQTNTLWLPYPPGITLGNVNDYVWQVQFQDECGNWVCVCPAAPPGEISPNTWTNRTPAYRFQGFRLAGFHK